MKFLWISTQQAEGYQFEISKAYYAKLTDVSAVVVKDGNTENPLAILDGQNSKWKKFYEPLGADPYWMGPEYKASR